MAFEPASLYSRLSEICRELGCPPGRNMIEWLGVEILSLRNINRDSLVAISNLQLLLEVAKEEIETLKREVRDKDAEITKLKD
jgi:hypothetical protein